MKKKVTFQNEKKTPRRERKGVKEFFRTKKEKENTFAFEPFSSYAEPIFLGQQREKRETPLFTNEKRYREPALDFKGIPAGEGVHSIHPYPAMLHPRLVQYLIEQYSAEGDIVVDPFLGSGVTAVESAVRERIFYGWDINPLAILISQVRATPINRSLVIQNLTVFKEKYSSLVPEKPGFPNIEYWFLPKTIVSLAKLKHLVKEVQDLSIRRFLFAIADARVGKTNIEEFFYEEMYLYSDPSAERFLSAFENSYVLLDIRMHAKTDNTVRNHGTAFRIPENRLSELYNRVERLV